MRPLRSSLLAALLAFGPPLVSGVALLVPSDARASVSIAVAFEALVKDADAVGIITPVESKSVWEDGRIYTYTRVKVDQGVAGALPTGAEGWVRTMGGVVGKIGQLVDGEAVLTINKPSLVFMRKFAIAAAREKEARPSSPTGIWEVSARAQGQYPVTVGESFRDTTKGRRVMRSAAVGVLLPPKAAQQADSFAAPADAPRPRLAGEVLHDRPLDEVTREVADTWKKLHPAPAPSDAKK